MRRYIIVLVGVALLVGSLFRGAERTGDHMFNMFGWLGLLIFGVIGSMALTRWQTRSGLKETEAALKLLEPACLITDWAYRGGGRPDFLVVGPGGVVAICLEETPRSTGAKRAAAKVVRGRDRVQESVRWLRDRLNEAAPGLKAPLGDLVREMPVGAMLVMTRREALPDYTVGSVRVVNPDGLAAEVRTQWERELLDEPMRIKLTRLFRQET